MRKPSDHLSVVRSRLLRSNPTDAEHHLWQRIRNRQVLGVRFNRQVPIGPFICDFVARTPGLIIELDGGQHGVRTGEDERRTAFLANRGFRLIRFWNHDVLANVEGVLEVIATALKDTPSPTPPESGRGLR